VSQSTLFWVHNVYHWEAVSHHTHWGFLIWRVVKSASGASVARSTAQLLTILNLEDWPQFETVDAAKEWCQQQNATLTD
jgi:hypothetical protein